MKAIVQDRFGPPTDVLRLEEVNAPAVGAGDALVRVEAAGVNAADWHLVAGLPLVMRPAFGGRRPKEPVPGLDVTGRVEAVGADVEDVAPGDEVFGWCTGAFAELVRVPAGQLVRRPAGISAVQAATLPTAGCTALQGWRIAGLAAGNRVLVTGASGGVGTFAVQIAKARGAHVTGVCSTGNVELVRGLGADEVVDYSRDPVPPRDGRYDVMFHLAGRVPLPAMRGALTPTGTLVLSTGDGGRWFGPLPFIARAVAWGRLGRLRVRLLTTKPDRDDLAELADLVAGAAVTPVLDRTYSLDEAPAAVAYLQQGHTRGKVVITT